MVPSRGTELSRNGPKDVRKSIKGLKTFSIPLLKVSMSEMTKVTTLRIPTMNLELFTSKERK